MLRAELPEADGLFNNVSANCLNDKILPFRKHKDKLCLC